jgi:hypothetical protein
MLVVCWSGDTSGQILVTLSGRGDIGQAVVSESANQVSDQLSRCGVVDWSVVGEIVGETKNMAVHANHGHHDIVLPVQKQGKDN